LAILLIGATQWKAEDGIGTCKIKRDKQWNDGIGTLEKKKPQTELGFSIEPGLHGIFPFFGHL